MKEKDAEMKNGFLTGAAVLISLAGAHVLPAQPAAPPPPEPLVQAMTVLAGGSFLGIGVREVNAERVQELKLKEERGVEITTIDADSPAAKAGLQKGDVVLEYNGQRVEGVSQFVRMVRETPAGRAAKLLVSRNGATQTIAATVAERKAMSLSGNSRTFTMPRITLPDTPRPVMSWRTGQLGIEAEPLEGQLAQHFGVKEGVLVRSVAKESVAEKAGLKAGDVIIKVGEESVSSPQDISSAMRDRGEKKTVALTVMRERKESALSITFDESAPAKRAPARSVRVQEFRF
jgi:serine protease Do